MFSLICLAFQVESLVSEKLIDLMVPQPAKEAGAEVSVIADRKQIYLQKDLSTRRSIRRDSEATSCMCLSRRSSSCASSTEYKAKPFNAATSKLLEARLANRVRSGLMTSSEVERILLEELIEGEREHKLGVIKLVNDHCHTIAVLLNDLSGGMIRLSDVCNVNVVPTLKNFEMLLANIFAYGTGYFDLKDYR